jgi:uncharacterized membrane protein
VRFFKESIAVEGTLALLALLLLVLLIGTPVLLVVLFARTSHIDGFARRLEQLERQVRQLQTGGISPNAAARPSEVPLAIAPPAISPSGVPASAPDAAEIPVDAVVLAEEVRSQPRPMVSWEDLIGRKALGWVAVVTLLFATAFFLKYAFENQWIGPIGRVSIGILAGLALVVDGYRRHRLGWRNFAQMLTAAGIVLLYLSMYGAFGFYHLIGQREAGIFLFVLVVESALLALAYEAPAIALMAIVGGLLTPVLMHSERDQYVSLFTYLGVLNAGVVGLILLRAWPAIGTVALLGTHGLFWGWYGENYHPEKFAWALGFQALVFVLYLLQSLLVNFLRSRKADWEDVARMLLNAAFWTGTCYVLLDDDYHVWMGSLAVGMAAVYALVARCVLLNRKRDNRLALAAVAVSMSYLALAFPLQADAPWVSLGWAAEAGVLWWFGVRVRSAPLRAMAAVFAGLAVGRLLFIETPQFYRAPFTLLLNDYALPALAAVACLSLALVATRRRLGQLAQAERVLVAIAAVGCVLLVWFVISVDLWGYFQARSYVDPDELHRERITQMSLSAWWSVYAAVVLAVGFRARQAWMRWTALGLFGLTVCKVFLFDMAGLDQIYRIVAFFVLAFLLGAAAWAYQRIQPADETTGSGQG